MTTPTSTPTTAVTADDLTSIAQEVWESVLGMSLVAADPVHPLGSRTLTGCAHVSGTWSGSVLLQCDADVARFAAEVMFAAAPGALSPDEVSDALGELTNMVSGNVKSLLPAPSRLSVPSVAEGDSCTVRVPGAQLVERVRLACVAGPLSVSVWESPAAG